MKKVGLIMGSDSDLPVVQKAVDKLKALEVPYEAHIYSAHRTPVEAKTFAEISDEIKDAVDYVVRYNQRCKEKHEPSKIVKIGIDGQVKIIRG